MPITKNPIAVVIKQPELPGPVVIELAPPAAAPSSRQAALPPAREQVTSNPSPDKPIEQVEEKTEEKTAAKDKEKVEPKPVEEPPRAVAPMTSTPSVGTKAKGATSTKGVIGGEIPAGAQEKGMGANPIDTRIADPHSKKATKANDWKKIVIVRPAKNSGERQQARDPGAAGGGTARNAIGIHVQVHAGAQGAHTDLPSLQPNAIGVTTKAAVGGPATNAVNGPTRNAVGLAHAALPPCRP